MTAPPPPGTASLPMLAFNNAWDLLDAQARWSWSVFDAQRAFAQPWIDVQASMLQAWIDLWSWPGPGAWLMRGTEQLA